MPREAVLVRTFVELADTLVDDFDVVELLTLLADRCVDVLDVGPPGSCWSRPKATCGSWPRRAKRCGYSSCSSCRPRRVRASSATAPASRS